MRLLVISILVLLSGRAAAQSARTGPLAPAKAAAEDGRAFPFDVIRGRCIEFAELKRSSAEESFHDCQVSKFDEFGTVDGQAYYYALYCLIPNYLKDKTRCGDGSFNATIYRQRALAIFTREAGSASARLLFDRVSDDIGLYYYQEPEIAGTPAGTVLYLKIALDGTAHGNESEYYLREGGAWQPIEAKAWLEDLQRRIPAGLEIWKGVWPDLKTLRAEAGLYRSGDANCCPTGGVARIQLAIREWKFVIESVDNQAR